MSLNTLWVVLLVAASVWTGRVLQKRHWLQEGWATVALLATSIIAACFQVLGYAAVLSGYPCFTVMWAAGLSLALAVLISAVYRDIAAALAQLPRLAGWRPDRGAAVFVGAGIVLYAILIVAAVIAGPWGWDSIAYHVPTAIVWLRTGLPHDPSLLPVYVDLMQPGFIDTTPLWPANAALSDLLIMAATNVRFVAVGQAAFALIAAAFVGGIAREMGTAKMDRRLASLAFLATPIVAFQAITPYADLFAACWFLAATYYLLVLLRSHPSDSSALPLIGLSLGLAVGAKYGMLPYAVMLGALVVVVLLLRYVSIRPGTNMSLPTRGVAQPGSPVPHVRLLLARWAIRDIGLLLVFGLLVASFWYVRMWVITGSPVFPIRVSIAGKQVVSGIRVDFFSADKEVQRLGGQTTRSKLRWLIYPWTNTAVSEEDGTGLQLALLLPGAVIVTLSRTWRGVVKRRPRDRAYIALSVLIIGTIGIWWNVASRDPRYVLWLWGFVFAIGTSIVSGVRRRSSMALRIVLLGAILVSMLAVAGPLQARAELRYGVFCTYADKTVVDFIESIPSGSTILNDYSPIGDFEISSAPCNTILAGKHLQHRVLGSERYFDANLDAETLRQRLDQFEVDYVLYWRLPGTPLRPVYSDSSQYPVVHVNENPVMWETIHRVQR